MFERAPLGIALIGSGDGFIHEVNAKFAEIAGRDREALIASRWADSVQPEDAEELLRGLALLSSRELSSIGLRQSVTRPDGLRVRVATTIAPILLGKSSETKLLCMVEDITERLSLERNLEGIQAKLDSAQEVARIGFWSYALPDGRIEWSKGLKAIFEMPLDGPNPTFEEFLGRVHPGDLAFVLDRSERQSRPMSEPVASYVYRIVTARGAVRYLEHIGRQSLGADGKVLGVYGSIQDITERRLAEEELKESEGKFKRLIREMQVGVLLQGSGAEVLLCNPKPLELLGLSEDQLLGKTSFDPYWNVVHEDGLPFPGEAHPVPQAIATGLPVRNTIMGVARARDRDRVWLSVDAVPFLDGGGKVREVVCTFLDITERKRAEDDVQKLLREKEIILKEVHHRIKNNMGTIYGLLSIQADSLAIEPAKAVILDAASRVQSMMVLYDKLYRSGDRYSLSAQDFFPALIGEIAQAFPRTADIRIETAVEDIVLGAKLLSPLGIIVNELITNSMKYAFEGRSEGVVAISMRRTEELVSLVFSDDGIGLRGQADEGKSSGFGMQLIGLLVDQIKGTISIESRLGTGTKYEISFKS